MEFKFKHGVSGPTKNIGFKLSKVAYNRVSRFADQYGLTLSDAVRQMVGHCLAELDAKAGGESHG